MTYPTDLPQAAPPAESSEFQPSEEVGALVRFVVHSYEPAAQTPWGVRAEATAVIDVIDGSKTLNGRNFGPMKFSGKMLAPQLGQYVGQEIYGRLAAKPGQNANPAIWLDVVRPGDGEVVARWKAWVASGGSVAPQSQPAPPPPPPASYPPSQPAFGAQPPPQPPPAQPQPGPSYAPPAPGYQPPTYGQPAAPPQAPPPDAPYDPRYPNGAPPY